jgi:hypothetical protein
MNSDLCKEHRMIRRKQERIYDIAQKENNL